VGLDGQFTLLHIFDAHAYALGSVPEGALIQASDGKLYGTTALGGNINEGAFFSLGLDGTFTFIASYTYTTGIQPQGPLLEADDGSFYGVTTRFGANNHGTLYNVTKAGVFTVLVDFDVKDAVAEGLVFSPDHSSLLGVFTGTHKSAGVFQYHFADHSFTVTPLPGSVGDPVGGLTLGPDGSTFYGFCATHTGTGCLYAMAADGTFAKAARIKWAPGGSPTFDGGDIVGTTAAGGKNGVGSAFRISGF
jgi:uncharacterized repeat protein (TIGR03803 family)